MKPILHKQLHEVPSLCCSIQHFWIPSAPSVHLTDKYAWMGQQIDLMMHSAPQAWLSSFGKYTSRHVFKRDQNNNLYNIPDPAVREAATRRLLLLHWVGAHYTHARAQYQRQDARASGISSARKAVVVSPNRLFLIRKT